MMIATATSIMLRRHRTCQRIGSFAYLLSLFLLCRHVGSFTQTFATTRQRTPTLPPSVPTFTTPPSSSTQLNMFMGSDGGILGVGGPELFTILLVGYFVLGPSDLYKIVKEVGKFVQNIRSLGNDLTTTLETNMESTLQLEEIRKAQRELNDAFSFRRSINVDQESDAFSVAAGSAQQAERELEKQQLKAKAEEAELAASAAGGTKKKKIRRRVKRRPPQPTVEEENTVEAPTLTTSPALTTEPASMIDTQNSGNIPDLEMPQDSKAHSFESKLTDQKPKLTDEELATIESEFDQYTSPPEENNRFQQQLSGQWNDQILTNNDKLEPMALLMQQIAILEQERQAATKRLEEEYAERQQVETQFYERKRTMLERGIAETQAEAFGVSSSLETTKENVV